MSPCTAFAPVSVKFRPTCPSGGLIAMNTPPANSTLNTELILTRRKILSLGTTAIGSAVGVPAIVSVAVAQDDKMTPLSTNNALASAAIASAKRFRLGKQVINLDLNLKAGISGTVKEYTLPAEAAKTLGRRTSI